MILDACAAPGGKSTHLASLMGKGSLLVSNELIATRISALKENLIKWGNPNVVITGSDPSAFSAMENLFDLILVDAPCSGEGLFRKDPSAVNSWSESACELNAARQQRILTALLPSLKPEGILIYSTCTFNPAENQRNIRWLNETQDMQCIPLSFPEEWGIRTVTEKNAIGYEFLPHRVRGEGLFISVLRKSDEAFPSRKLKPSRRSAVHSYKGPRTWINSSGFELVQKDEFVVALPEQWMSEIGILSRYLKVIYSGCTVAGLKNKPVPDHALAVSTLLNRDEFPAVELSLEQALKYLRKEEFRIPISSKGFCLFTFQGFPLGWINNLEQRFNNYYPVNWRIRMQ